MVISLKHNFTSAKSDGADSTMVQPSNWNAEHTLTQATNRLLGRTTASTGATEEISVGSNLSFTSTTLNLASSVSVTALSITGTDSVNIAAGTTAQRVSTTTGAFRFNTSISKFEGYNGSAWGSVGGGATGGGADEVFIQNGQTMTTNYTIPADKNAMSTGPITINAGITLTVSSGARYVVI